MELGSAGTPLEDGDPIEMVFGGQGAWHLEPSIEVRGAEHQVHRIAPRAWRVDTGEPLTDQLPANTALVGWDADTCAGRMPGVVTLLVHLPRDDTGLTAKEAGCLLVGSEVDLELEVTDLVLGTAAADRVRLHTTTTVTCP